MRLWLSSWLVFLCIDAYMMRRNLKLLIDNLCVTAVCFLNSIKVTFFMIKMDKVITVKNDLANNLNLPHIGHSDEDRKILYNAERETQNIGLVLWASATLLSISLILAPIANADDKPFPLPFPKLFNYDETPSYECVYAYHVFTLCITTLLIISYDLIFCSFLNSICAHFSILIKNLNETNQLFSETDLITSVEGWKEFLDCNNFKDMADMKMDAKSYPTEEKRKIVVKMMKNNIRHHQVIIR